MSKTTKVIKSVKKARLEARISSEQKELVLEAASIQGRSLTDFVVSTVTEAAKMVVEQHTIMQLSKKDSELFVSKILESRLPSDKLKQAAQNYTQILH